MTLRMRNDLYDDLTYDQVRERLAQLRRLETMVALKKAYDPYPLGGLQSRIEKLELILDEFHGIVS